MIRSVVADDHPVTRLGIIAILARDSALEIVGEAVNGPETIALCRHLLPDLLILDIHPPQLDGLRVTQHLVHDSQSPAIVLLSAYSDAAIIHASLAAGASGYILKSTPADAILAAIHRIVAGERPVLVGVSVSDGGGSSGLSLQETLVLSYVADGLTTKEIAHRLGVSTRTVDTYLTRIFRKLGTTTRTQAVTVARRTNLLPE